MRQTKLWLGMMAMLLCNLLPIHAESVTVRFGGDWTSTNHSDGSTSSETYTFTAIAGATLSFDWWVSSEASYDKLIVTLDGSTILEKSGSLSGTYNNAITQGKHTLVVKYTKDGSQSSGSDQANVSNLTTTTTDGFAYSTTGNTACVIGAIDTAEVVIPSNVTINDTVYLVTSIGSSAFYNCNSLTSITIPEGVTSIGNYAFNGCTSLKEVIIEDGSTALSLGYNYYYSSGTGQGLFYDCPLEKVYLGRNLSYSSGSSYGYSPFYKSNRVPTISLGDSITSIPSFLFYNNSSLTSITIPESVTSIGSSAFSGCSSLASITIPEGVTSIGNYAFNGCTSLKEVIIEEGSTTLSLGYNHYYSSGTGQGLFYDCPLEKVYLGRNLSYSSGQSYGYSPFFNKYELTSVTVGDSVTSIGSNAFYGCSSLTSITIPEGVTSIGSNAFYGCSSLTSITIPEGVTSIGNSAFSGCI